MACLVFITRQAIFIHSLSDLFEFLLLILITCVMTNRTRVLDIETLTPSEFVDIMIMYLKEKEYKITN